MCKRNNFDYDFIWDILEEDIIDMIPSGDSLIIIDDKQGNDYLGRTYKLKEVKDYDNI